MPEWDTAKTNTSREDGGGLMISPDGSPGSTRSATSSRGFGNISQAQFNMVALPPDSPSDSPPSSPPSPQPAASARAIPQQPIPQDIPDHVTGDTQGLPRPTSSPTSVAPVPIPAPVPTSATRRTERSPTSTAKKLGTPARRKNEGKKGRKKAGGDEERKSKTKTAKRNRTGSSHASTKSGSGTTAAPPSYNQVQSKASASQKRQSQPVQGKNAGSGGSGVVNSAAPDKGGPQATGLLARRLLEVDVIEAAGLLGTSSKGSNPKALLSLVDLAGKQIQSEGMLKTPVLSNTVNPVWNFRAVFGQRLNLSQASGANLPILRVQVVSSNLIHSDDALGRVDIPLERLSPKGEEWQQWYDLEPFGKLRPGSRFGSIHLRLKIGPVISRGGTQVTTSTWSLPESREDGGDEEEVYRQKLPNFLRVTVHQAHELLAKDVSTNSSDPVAILKLGGQVRRTKTINANLYPSWEETFEFPCTSSGESLEITIEDVDPIVNEFLGFVSILLGDLADKKKIRQWFDLKLKSGDLPPGEERGSVELTTQWFYNPDVASGAPKKKSAFISLSHHKDSDTEDDEMEKNDPNMQLQPTEGDAEADPEAMERRAAEREAQRKLLEELHDFKVKSGDYVAYVHIIEARELKGEDLQGTSDPVVHVEAFGQKFATEVQSNKLNAVFDETFVISLRDMDQEEFKEGVFRISVMDADVTVGHFGSVTADLIGAVSFDATYVYFNKDHEIHRRWVALVDDLNPKDVGVQGYLQLSIAIVGPDDRLKQHDEEEDRRRERAQEAASGGVDSLVVMPPSLELRQKWLVTTVAKAEYLPVMDLNLVGGAGGGDFFFQVGVGGGVPFRTKQITIGGERHKLNPEWRTELWQPVTLPCMSGNIKYSVWDWDPLPPNQQVGSFYGKLREIEDRSRSGDARKPRWVNLYGPPVYVPEIPENLGQIGRRAASLYVGVNWKEQYLDYPHLASTYRGRVLVADRVQDNPPPKYLKEKAAFRRKVKTSMVPASAQYVLKAFVGAGTEIPKFVGVTGTKNMWVKISLGRYEVSTQAVDNTNGLCEWYRALQLKSNFALPMDPEQVPDVILYLMSGTGVGALPCSFRRFKAKDLIDEKFGGKPQWFNLREDKVLDLLQDREFPGSVLVRLGFGPISLYQQNKAKWKDEFQGLLKREPYELRVHVYQARDLPAADDNGLMDPYLKIRFAGEEISTEDTKELRRRETVDPVWYYTMRVKADLPPIEFQRYFPQVSIQLFDWDRFGRDSYCGNLFLSLEDEEVIKANRRTTAEDLPSPPPPKWVPFFLEESGDGQGELLVSLQIIHTKSADLPEPPKIVPETRPAYLDMVILGIRDLQPYNYLPMQLPYCVFEVDDMDGTKRSLQTETSNKPSGSNANFLKRVKMKLELPREVTYAPRVKIRVYDTRLGGYKTPLVGSGRIDLTDKLPWAEGYKPPLSATFARDQLLHAVGVETEDDEDQMMQEAAGSSMHGPVPSAGSRRAGGAGAGVVWGSGSMFFSSDGGDGDNDSVSSGPDTDRGGQGAFGNLGQSGFRRHRPGLSSQGSSLLGGTRQTVYTPDNVQLYKARQRSGTLTGTTEFGGGAAGAIGVIRQRNWDTPANNQCIVSATGEVVDTGIGVMPALDAARQRAGLPTSSARAAAAASTAGGVAAHVGAGGSAGGVAGVMPAGAPPTMSDVKSGVKRARSVEGELWEEDDDTPEIAPYLRGRDSLEGSLEEELKTTPFETYDLYRGQTIGAGTFASLSNFFGGTSDQVIGGKGSLRTVGKLKCIVRVTEGEPENEPLFVDKKTFRSLAKAQREDRRILTELLKPRAYKVRLYALEARGLTPMDVGIAGRPGKSDPYLKVTLGKQVFDFKDEYIDDVTDADLYKLVEVDCELPGAGQLQIDMMDYDTIGRDDRIGGTVIDLEDRWFDTRWQAWGLHNRSEELSHMRWQTKPLEVRTLKIPTSHAPQGRLRCWLDLMPPEDAKAFEPDDIAPPPNLDFEVRVVVWRCKNVVAMDNFTEQNDMYVKCWVEGNDNIQQTDVHWFSKHGKATFNWRMKFKVSLGPNTQSWKFPYLTLQLWDKDIIKWDDIIAEGLLDLGPHFRKAYKNKEVVKLFQDPEKAAKKKEIEESEMRNMEIDMQAASLTTERPDQPLVANMAGGEPPNYETSVSNAHGSAAVSDGASIRPARPAAKKPQRSCLASCCRSFCCCGAKKAIGGAKVSPGEDSDDEARADAKAFIQSVKAFTGIGEDDPEESHWVRMEKRNPKTRKKEPMGECLLGVQIWPVEKAELREVGLGRDDPNVEPFLPAPAGRLRFSLNPFVMGTELFGAKICFNIYCVICIVLVILFCVYLSPILNLFISIINTICDTAGC